MLVAQKDQKPLVNTLERPVNPSLTLGMIKICVGAWGDMSLKARTCRKMK